MSEQPERDVQYRINLPERFFDDQRVADIFEDAANRIEALEPDRDWDALLSAEVMRPDAPVAAGATVTEWGVRCSRDSLDGDQYISEATDLADAERIKRHHDAARLGCEHTVVTREVTPWTLADGPTEGGGVDA